MDNPSIKSPVNDSRCVFFNTHSEDYRCVVILTAKRATGTFSLVGCMLMLFVIWLLRRYHSLAQKMILSLTVAAFFDSLAYVMGESHPEGSLCDFQAWWLTYFDWSALAWVCLITLNLYLNLVWEMSTHACQTFYHVTAWGVPLLMSSLPLLKGYYGPAGAWCWITDDHVAWRFGIWYVPLFTLILLMICCYARIICVAQNRMQSWLGTFNPERERRKVSLAEEIKPLKWYPSVYLLVSVFPLVNSWLCSRGCVTGRGSASTTPGPRATPEPTWPTRATTTTTTTRSSTLQLWRPRKSGGGPEGGEDGREDDHAAS
ncbi:si:dkey-100n23.5 isoform X2 [Syngnathoides biaculeatus]|uniref:si:dkey-100n23.5 isoform X2 n=1 Tax=Syngnathoides biaculeatus TaxID=300417 RepID=UPI002ADDBB21|nr:si:dkey-100n23.5 isoform X2 [Syngnathoides biaculeatus]